MQAIFAKMFANILNKKYLPVEAGRCEEGTETVDNTAWQIQPQDLERDCHRGGVQTGLKKGVDFLKLTLEMTIKVDGGWF